MVRKNFYTNKIISILCSTVLILLISTFSKLSYACDDVSGTTTISSDCSSAFSITGSNANITLSATVSSANMSLTNSGTNSSLTITSSGSLISTNGGIVIANTVAGKSFDLISNAGTISGTYFTIRNQKTITTLTNTGTITATEGNAAVLNQSSATITTFTNSGTISAPSGSGINNTATITTLTNTGTITSSGTDISNFAGTMVTLNNSQGKNGDDPLRLERFSTNYNIIINSTSDYGQLLLTNVENGTSTNFGIHSSSTLACETYSNVIDGVASGEIGSAKTGTFGDYSWTLSETSSGSETWDLTVTGSVSTCNTFTSPFLDSDSLAIVDGQINGIFNNTLNTVQTIHSRMGYIRMKEKNLSNQNIQLAYNGNNKEIRNIIKLVDSSKMLNLEDEYLSNIGFWSEGSIDLGKISGDSSSSSKSIFGNNITVGIDINMNDNYHLGFALGDSRDEIKIGSSGSNIDLHITTISSYHSLALSKTQYVDFVFGYGDIKVDTDRFYSSDSITYSGKRNGNQYFSSIGFNIMEEKNKYTINPFGRLDIGYGKLEHYTESTGTNALHYESVHLHQKNSALGLHLLRKGINGKALTFTPHGTIEFGSDSSQSSKIITNYTSDNTTLYETNISPASSAYFRQKISIDISSKNNLMINIFYDRVDRQNKGYDQKVGVGLKYNF